MSLFASYSNSFTPNTGIDVESKPLRPSYLDKYEVGMKNELMNGLFPANVTLYQIVNSDLVQSVIIQKGNPYNIPANARELADEVTSKGLEVDLMGKPVHKDGLSWAVTATMTPATPKATSTLPKTG